jgi:putative spermidine/putrescine transport system substrate-binding protein
VKWTVAVSADATIGGFYAQAISKYAPHPAAARLWEEYLYSADGQNQWLKAGMRPVEMQAMQTAGTLDPTAAGTLPPVTGTPLFMSPSQVAAARTYLAANWAKAVG